MREIFSVKSISGLMKETEGKKSLQRSISLLELILFGIGAVVGTGIFVITGMVAANMSGPALVLSFVISGAVCALAALTYTEFASAIPVAGSAYTYSYASLGEIWAWIIGWDLILEYVVTVSTASIGWSGYFNQVLQNLGIHLPHALTAPPMQGGIVNLPAILIIVLIALLLNAGVTQSKWLNNVIVTIKLVVLALFIIFAVTHVKPSNWSPFMPYGWSGVMRGASYVFFAYLGFDAISTTAEEVRNPRKNMPRGIIASLVICTLLYMVVSLILTGVVSYKKLDTAAPVAFALQQIGIHGGAAIISVGAICGITSVLLVMSYGATRIIFSMSRDGLLPSTFSKISQNRRTPGPSTFLVALCACGISGFMSLEMVSQLANIGTLAAFAIVAIGIIVLRKREPDLARPFRCPWVPFIPILSAATCVYLAWQLDFFTKLRFVVWLAIGLVIYFAYSRHHSTMRHPENISEGE
ncbi:MAG TPA: amino acid permease [Ruminococcaceae bacterium]|nr:amino acid permease [Oscillospiraceae bacterium]